MTDPPDDFDEFDFDEFYRRAWPGCLRAAAVTVRDSYLTEELVAEAFSRALERWDRLRSHPNPEAWVVRTTINLSRRRWRRRQREHDLTPPSGQFPRPSEPTDATLLAAVADLPERQREVIAYRIILGASANDTADALGIAPSTVGVHLHRAMRTLQAHPDVIALAAHAEDT